MEHINQFLGKVLNRKVRAHFDATISGGLWQNRYVADVGHLHAALERAAKVLKHISMESDCGPTKKYAEDTLTGINLELEKALGKKLGA